MPVLNPYTDVQGLPSDFWGSPVLKDDNGQLYCPGYTGNTYSSNGRDKMFIQVPFGSGKYPTQPYTPGIVTVDVTKSREFDEKKAKGRDGGRLTTHGLNLGEVDVSITIWTPQQLLELQRLVVLLFPGFTKTTTTSKVVAGTRTEVVPSGDTVTSQTQAIDPLTGKTKEKFTVQRNFNTVTIPQVGSVFGTRLQSSSTSTNEAVPFECAHPELALAGIKSLYFLKQTGLTMGTVAGTRVFKFMCREFVKPGKVNVTKTAVASKDSVLSGGRSRTPGSNPANLKP